MMHPDRHDSLRENASDMASKPVDAVQMREVRALNGN
jgi:hypothetical protein